jgi:hypothetical protein
MMGPRERMSIMAKRLSGVMAGLVPAIHALLRVRSKDVDARDKRGHDGGKCDSIAPKKVVSFASLCIAGQAC